ncbi:hypothetical protein J5277_02525 [Rhizobium sp. 16-449-1b]|uniref:hypothetical protein n=1 Tax=Rhizobium sp. 16-449-1b TaxID=2819989 RepID=UPI001AD9F885|nr:hypothetical protein [Rhizobium sp. 16-449-1b]MBO9192974.1 hypothetical protein [Rhizobium sp. 16-449-1b]
MGQNETKRHFELRNLDKDMEKAAKDASYVITKERAKQMKGAGRALLICLVVVVLGFCLLLSTI